MSADKVPIRVLPTGVPGLDEVLGGGIPEFSFNLIAGGPGCGKTTLGHQILFANATPERKAIYFTIMGEPPIKMLRYQQQYSFFDMAKIEESIRFIHLGDEAKAGGLAAVLARIQKEVVDTCPALVAVDSFRSMFRGSLPLDGSLGIQDFVQRLALHLTNCEATTFLLGEYGEGDHDSDVFTVADGLIWLYQAVDRNSVVRKVHVMKIRGQAQIPGLHTARITNAGVSVFPRLLKPEGARAPGHRPAQRISTGVPTLDEMMGGGIPRGYSVLVAGPSGSGKTVLSNQFLVEGARHGEAGILAVFEKRPEDYLATAPHGAELEKMLKDKQLEILYLRPLDLSIDETLLALRDAVDRVGAKRAVIDSLSGLELALAPTFREDFRESLYRMIGALTGSGVTVMGTVELADSYTDLQFSPQGVAFLTDAIVMQRYIEIEGQLRRALSVVKVRSSPHSKDLREYEITQEGLMLLGRAIKGYEGILSGAPNKLAVLKRTKAGKKNVTRRRPSR
jgi:circadian clock protein KaiC